MRTSRFSETVIGTAVWSLRRKGRKENAKTCEFSRSNAAVLRCYGT